MSKIKNNNNAPEGLSLRRDVHAFIQQERNEPVTVTETVKLSTSIANSQAAHYDVVYARTTRASELTKNDDPKSLFDFRNYGPEAIIPQNAAASVLSLNLKLTQNKQISVNSTLKVDKSVVIQEALEIRINQEQTINVTAVKNIRKKFLRLCYFDAVIAQFPADNAANKRFFYTGIPENQHPPGNILFAEARIKFPEKFAVSDINNVYPVGITSADVSGTIVTASHSSLFDRYTLNPVATLPFSLNNNKHNAGRQIKPLVHIHYYPLIGFSYYYDGAKFVLDNVFINVSPFINESFTVEAELNNSFARYAEVNTINTTDLSPETLRSAVRIGRTPDTPFAVTRFPNIKTNLSNASNPFVVNIAPKNSNTLLNNYPEMSIQGNFSVPRYTLPKYSNGRDFPNGSFLTYPLNRIYDNTALFLNQKIRRNGLLQDLRCYSVTEPTKISFWCSSNSLSEEELKNVLNSNNIDLPYQKKINKGSNRDIKVDLSNKDFRVSNYTYVQKQVNTSSWEEHFANSKFCGFEHKPEEQVVELNLITFTKKEKASEIPRVEPFSLKKLTITSSLVHVYNDVEYSILPEIFTLAPSSTTVYRNTEYFNGGDLLLGLKLSITSDLTGPETAKANLNFYLYSDQYATNAFGSFFTEEDQKADLTGRGARVRNYNQMFSSDTPVFSFEGYANSDPNSSDVIVNNYFFQNDRRQSFKFSYNIEFEYNNALKNITVSNIINQEFSDVFDENTTRIGGTANVLPGLVLNSNIFNLNDVFKTTNTLISFKVKSNFFQSDCYISGVNTANLIKNTTLTNFTGTQQISDNGQTPVNNEIGFMLNRINQRIAGTNRKQQIETLEIHDILP